MLGLGGFAKKGFISGVIGSALLGLSFSWAGGLTAPFDLESASVLPKNIRSPRFKNISLKMEDKWNLTGSSEPLGASLNKTLTFQTLVDSQESQQEKALAAGTVLANEFSLSDSPGQTTGRINTSVDVKVPIFSYGLTDATTLALVVPVYDIQVKADTGFVASQKAQLWVNEIAEVNPLKAQEIANQLTDPVNLKLQKLGYNPIRSKRTQGVGDMKVVTKSVLWHTEKQAVAVKSTLTAPTGTRPNADEVVDTPTGDGQWDLGVRGVWDGKLSSNLTLTGFAGYTAQLPDELVRRIPLVQGDPLSADKEVVVRDSGDQVDLGASVVAGFSSGLNFGAGYAYQYMTPTTFRGTQYSQERYQYLSELNSEQDLHSVTLALGYSTIDAYKAGRFVIPLQLNGFVSQPLQGRNVVTSAVYSTEFVMFF